MSKNPIFPINSMLTFEIPQASTAKKDTETGNPVILHTKIMIQASLHPSSPTASMRTGTSSQREISGINPTDVFLFGRAVSPKIIPPILWPGSRHHGKIVYTDPATKEKMQGTFLLLAVMPSRHKIVTTTIGNTIQGIMQNIQPYNQCPGN
ncbi:MAG: hypothetical protein F6K10_04935 [Moorea sp. SIO2B7]|nr:hypothetical protein [Moorena sp. SIO2B7]